MTLPQIANAMHEGKPPRAEVRTFHSLADIAADAAEE